MGTFSKINHDVWLFSCRPCAGILMFKIGATALVIHVIVVSALGPHFGLGLAPRLDIYVFLSFLKIIIQYSCMYGMVETFNLSVFVFLI